MLCFKSPLLVHKYNGDIIIAGDLIEIRVRNIWPVQKKSETDGIVYTVQRQRFKTTNDIELRESIGNLQRLV